MKNCIRPSKLNDSYSATWEVPDIAFDICVYFAETNITLIIHGFIRLAPEYLICAVLINFLTMNLLCVFYKCAPQKVRKKNTNQLNSYISDLDSLYLQASDTSKKETCDEMFLLS